MAAPVMGDGAPAAGDAPTEDDHDEAEDEVEDSVGNGPEKITGVSQRNRDSCSSSPELSFKFEEVSTRTLSDFTRTSPKWNSSCRKVNSPYS